MAYAMSAFGDHMRHLPTLIVLGVGQARFEQALVAFAERMGVA